MDFGRAFHRNARFSPARKNFTRQKPLGSPDNLAKGAVPALGF
jgi:hypothetical protein